MKNKSTINEAEISHFAKDSLHWWDESGPFAPLHQLNPVRLDFILAEIGDNPQASPRQRLKGLHILDVGCGGGLVCEPLARLGATVTGLDADVNAIKAAKNHAENYNLKIDYRADDLTSLKKKYDVTLALEVLEHVDHPNIFIKQLIGATKPGGLIIISTLNRTAKSFALGIVTAEYILGWVPKGTHQWNKFLKPHEVDCAFGRLKAQLADIKGIIYNPLSRSFALSDRDTDVNYIMSFRTAK